MNFCNDVNDWLITGGDLSLAADVTGDGSEEVITHLCERGVTHVLDVRSEWTDSTDWYLYAPQVKYQHAPIVDSHYHSCSEDWFVAVETFVENFWLDSNEGDKLYTHCHMGINRGTSAAMLALLTVNPDRDPFGAFLEVRAARPIAGLVYAEQVGRRHLVNKGLDTAEFDAQMRAYWTPELRREVHRGIAWYRSAEGGTIKVGGESVISCPTNATHRIKWNSGNPACLDCNKLL